MARTNRSSPNVSEIPETPPSDAPPPEEVIEDASPPPAPLPEQPHMEWEVPGEIEDLTSLETWGKDCKAISPELIGGFTHHARAINLRYDTPSGWKAKAIAWSRKPV